MSFEAAKALIGRLRAQGAEFTRESGKLKLAAPEGSVTPDIAAEIRAHKDDILALLDERLAAAPRATPLPLGVVQERMWAHAEMEPETLLYNLPAAWRFKGPFDAVALRGAFDDFIARHEILRLRIVMADGLPKQTFAPSAPGALAGEDLSGLDSAARLAERIEALRAAPIDLAAGPAFVARLFRLGPVEHALFFMPHHLVWDGWCFDIFLRDLRELYLARIERRAPHLPALTIQYADYAVWHRRRIESGGFAADLGYWERTLADPPPPPNLPTDRARPDLFSAEGDWTEFAIEPALLDKIKNLAAKARATTFMTFLTLWRVFLLRICGDPDIIIGAPIQARQHAEIADVVGCFVNTIFLRQKVDPTLSLAESLSLARHVCVEAYQRQEAPVETLADKLAQPRDPSRTPLAQVMFTHQHIARRPEDFGATALTQIHVNPRMSPTDLMLAVMEGRDAARGLIHFATGVFSPAQAQCVARAFETFMRGALDRPDTEILSIPLVAPVTAAEDDAPAGPLLPDMIAEAAARAPRRTAVRCGAQAIDYAGLMARALALGDWLADKGVGPGDIVGLMTPRGPDMIALILAIWRRGAAYLPLDPAYPAQRLVYMIADSGAKLIVATSDIAHIETAAPRVNIDAEEGAIAAERSERAPPIASERAYVIYTSGSTGKPKGVENSHAALSNFIRSMIDAPGVGAEDRLLAVTTLSFDISILELFAPLAVGGEVIIASADEAADGDMLRQLIDTHRPTILQATPASWRLLLDAGLGATRGLKALCGGEAMTAPLAEALLGKVGELWNMYGPTETTVWSTLKKIERADAVTIGAPIAATKLHVVGFGEQLMPDGVAGELWIGGAGVAIGYLNRPALTAERFRADPFRRGRAYRTGDLARRLADGEIEHLGRMDGQVKLRGFRIELGEIEAAIEAHEAVARAIAAVKKDAAGEPTLVAYILYKDGMSATGSDLRRLLRQTLPGYMLPQLFAEIAGVPLTGSGKVDRNALPDPAGGPARPRPRTAPSTQTQEAIAAIWRDILKTDDISITDNFFELGGQSLQAAQMAARYRALTGMRIAPRSVIFDTLEQLAAGVDRL